ncbi:MAG: helix-turn-helix domain-containing protein [Alphaproteobacteria bacterium]
MNINPAVTELKKLTKEYNISQVELSKRAFIPQNRISDLLYQKRRFTLESDLKLCKVFNLNPTYFLNLQQEFELKNAQNKYKNLLGKIIPL